MADVEDTLEVITGKIRFMWRKDDERRAALAVLVAQAKKMVVEGTDPYIKGRKWYDFAFEEFDRGPREIRKLLAIGRAPNPAAAHEAEKAATRERVQAHRERQMAALPPPAVRTAALAPPGPRGSAPDEVDNFVKAWSVIPSHRRDEALALIGARRAQAETQRAA
jgi:hypothetical protein